MAFAAIIAPIFSAVSAIAGGMAAAQQAKYQAEVAKMNEKIAYDNARRAIDRSQVEQLDYGRQVRAMLGEQEATQAASGLSMFGKTQMRTRKAAREMGMLDQLRIRQSGELESYAYKTDAVNWHTAAQAKKMEASNSMLGGFLKAAGSLISDFPGPFGGSSGAKYTSTSTTASSVYTPRTSTANSYGPNFTYLNPKTGMFGGGV